MSGRLLNTRWTGQRRSRFLVWVLFWVLAWTVILAVEGCGGGQETVTNGDEDTTVAAQVNRIAYVSPAGEIFTVGPDGSGLTQITGAVQAGPSRAAGVLAQPLNLNEYHAWPTWSPDGSKIAVSRVTVNGGRAEISVQVVDVATSRIETVHRNETPALVADGTPHYLYWSPDSESLAFLASAPQGLTLFVWGGGEGEAAVPVDVGAPLYFHWAQGSQSLALHIDTRLLLDELPFGGPQIVTGAAEGFRVPAFSPDGSQLAFIARSGGSNALFVAPAGDPTASRKLLDVAAVAAFLWSPDGTKLAVAGQRDPRAPIFQLLVSVSADTGEVQDIAEEQVMAFYWSPDGERLAWVRVDAEQREMEWVVASGSGDSPNRVFRYHPSGEVFTMFSFFDQYAYSHSPWSPDGRFIVTAGTQTQASSGRNGSTPTSDHVFVIDAKGEAQPKDIGAGTLAVWSWN